MLIKVKNIISKADRFLFKKFGSDKTIKSLENLKEARIIFSYLNEIGKETVVRFVGGCVRKALSGETVDDIDLATSLEPEVVKNKLAKNNVKVIDTGILHGTVTAILSNKKFNKDFFDNLLPYPRSRFSKYSDGIKKISTTNITD